MTMTDPVECEMRNYENSDNLQFNIRNMNVVHLFSLVATTDAKDSKSKFLPRM